MEDKNCLQMLDNNICYTYCVKIYVILDKNCSQILDKNCPQILDKNCSQLLDKNCSQIIDFQGNKHCKNLQQGSNFYPI